MFSRTMDACIRNCVKGVTLMLLWEEHRTDHAASLDNSSAQCATSAVPARSCSLISTTLPSKGVGFLEGHP
jgi:hypothetical protein